MTRDPIVNPTTSVDDVRRRCEQRIRCRWSLALSYATPYARAAFESEVEAVATAPEGARNHTLFVASCNLTELINGGQLPPTLVWNALWTAAVRNGLPAREAERTIESAVRKTAGKARTTPPRRDGRR